MWREMEEDAIRIGLHLDYYWSLNPKQFEKYIKIYNEKEKERFKEKDTLNHLLGQYIYFAFNDPQKYPKKPFTYEEPKKTEMTISDMERQARINTITMGGVIK
jgi:hypothetical protein